MQTHFYVTDPVDGRGIEVEVVTSGMGVTSRVEQRRRLSVTIQLFCVKPRETFSNEKSESSQLDVVCRTAQNFEIRGEKLIKFLLNLDSVKSSQLTAWADYWCYAA